MRIDGLPNAALPSAGTAAKSIGQSNQPSPFARVLADSLNNVSELQSVADEKVQQLATGEIDNVQDVVMAMAEADLSFRLVLEIRNKLVESYQEIMRLQV